MTFFGKSKFSINSVSNVSTVEYMVINRRNLWSANVYQQINSRKVFSNGKIKQQEREKREKKKIENPFLFRIPLETQNQFAGFVQFVCSETTFKHFSIERINRLAHTIHPIVKMKREIHSSKGPNNQNQSESTITVNSRHRQQQQEPHEVWSMVLAVFDCCFNLYVQ